MYQNKLNTWKSMEFQMQKYMDASKIEDYSCVSQDKLQTLF